MNTELRCSGCGAEATASCACGLAYIPAGEYAKKVLAQQPGMSNRALAEKIGVSYKTIERARATGTFVPVEKRMGLDGKMRPATQPPRPPKPDPVRETVRANLNTPTSELVGETGVGARRIDTVKREERIREEARQETFDKLEASVQEVELPQRYKIYIQIEANKRLKQELDRRPEHIKMYEDQIFKWAERTTGQGIRSKPFSYDDYVLILACLHPDGGASAEKRTQAFVKFNTARYLICDDRDKDLSKRQDNPLPKTLEELMRHRDEYEAKRRKEWKARKKAKTPA